MVIPLFLDFLLWLGPRLSPAQLIEGMLERSASSPALSAEMLQAMQENREAWLEAGRSFNLLSLLAIHYPGIPSLMANRAGYGQTVSLDSSLAVMSFFLLLPLVGMLLASFYYAAIGNQVGPQGGSLSGAGALAWRVWGRLLALAVLVLALSFVVLVPIAILMMMLGSLGSSLMSFLTSFLMVAFFWLQFYLFFLMEALVISDVGPLQAMRNSVAVVKHNLSSSLGLVMLSWIITLGMPVVWNTLSENPVGAIPAMLGNAYIASGLAAATMIFYRDRFSAIQSRMAGNS